MTAEGSVAEIERLSKRVERERRARQEAELLAEQGTRQLYERQRELELLNAIADAANGARSVDAAIQVTLDRICEYTAWPVGHAYTIGADPDVLIPSTLWHLDQPQRTTIFRQITEGMTLRRGEGLPGRVLESGQSIWIVDVSEEINFPRRQQSEDLGVRGAFAFPVLIDTTVVAVLEFFSCERVEPDEAWLKIAAQAGKQLGRIFERNKAAVEMERVHVKLVDLSRRAGMAEVATGVLHNVGNVLNSVSVSSSLIGSRLRKSNLENLRLGTAMLREHKENLADFLTNDPKGKLLPEYLSKVAGLLEKENAALIAEAASVAEHVEHIKHIVSMQQNHAKVSGMDENLSPAELVEDAVRMNRSALERHRIQLFREIDPSAPKVRVDRHKVLQILINLIRNAKDAMDEQNVGHKKLIFRVACPTRKTVEISIIDNGVGVDADHLTKIFNHGFTTKKEGHGFGLHSGANAAREMGGRLSVRSDGKGTGATFILELPVAQAGIPGDP